MLSWYNSSAGSRGAVQQKPSAASMPRGVSPYFVPPIMTDPFSSPSGYRYDGAYNPDPYRSRPAHISGPPDRPMTPQRPSASRSATDPVYPSRTAPAEMSRPRRASFNIMQDKNGPAHYIYEPSDAMSLASIPDTDFTEEPDYMLSDGDYDGRSRRMRPRLSFTGAAGSITSVMSSSSSSSSGGSPRTPISGSPLSIPTSILDLANVRPSDGRMIRRASFAEDDDDFGHYVLPFNESKSMRRGDSPPGRSNGRVSPNGRPTPQRRDSVDSVRSVRWSENLICPSPIPQHMRRKGWFNRRGDQLWTNEGQYLPAPPGQEYPLDLEDYPEEGNGWQNEEGVRIDVHHRLIPKAPLRPALKKVPTRDGSLSSLSRT